MGNDRQQKKDHYFVAVKIFLVDSSDRLLIIRDIYDDGWDIPGGRLREIDFDVPLEEVVERKIREELGEQVRYELWEQTVLMRHERLEGSSGEKRKERIFAVGYRAKFLGGTITLGEIFKEYKWVDLNTFVPEKYFVGGWLRGVKEFQARKKSVEDCPRLHDE
jgi:ADP-ribose pyrophosphatase YjhB (NUDIX family)